MTAKEAHARISSPTLLHGIRCRNRIVRSATNEYRGNPDGTISDEQLRIYGELADGGSGLLISGNFYVSEDGRLDLTQPGLCGLKTKEQLKRLTDTVHAKGCAIIAQISHAGRKTKINPNWAEQYETPAMVSKSQIEKLCRDFAKSAYTALECGFDGIQLHCAHGYLLSDFLDPIINDRLDEYSGTAENRMRFPAKIIRQIKASCGTDYPLLIKIAATISYNAEWDTERYTELFMDYLRIFQDSGVHAAEISGFNLGGYKKTDHNYFENELRIASEVTKLPLILTGGIRSMEDVRSAFSHGADFIGISRPLIRDPYFAKRLIYDCEPSACISCNACYNMKEPGGKRCPFNKLN